jgi:hypothetical protein
MAEVCEACPTTESEGTQALACGRGEKLEELLSGIRIAEGLFPLDLAVGWARLTNTVDYHDYS